jgi:uncharacterized protein YacL (UPF0231 family)
MKNTKKIEIKKELGKYGVEYTIFVNGKELSIRETSEITNFRCLKSGNFNSFEEAEFHIDENPKRKLDEPYSEDDF